FLAEAEDAVLVADADLTPQRLTGTVLGLVQDPGRLAAMSARCRELVPSGAAEALARLVITAGKAG
ncbi:MAG: UDP-N-acetylglucosamine--N-acetylmuramyl-(pentapeptide) pyrophosphoryl-undecaprenol N-acetylglucosamine transferase, partial [Propionibacteriaceae bacterium]|nr:UDP-N-acetylglucosamine--N-acetylmuramyl-(pentapeptide) pyrophosphoryl-undecaprenol N-acetylglucosamine transferase [Propionibacteriaceae bacterium]